MKIIAVSDSHGSSYNIKALFSMHKDADYYIHLGDGCEDFVRLCVDRNLPYLAVRGNCDVYSKLPYEEILQVGGKKLFMTHGHLYGVKSSTEKLMYAGSEREADIILFGHTHEGLCEYVDEESLGRPFYLVNPGSIAQPMLGNPTFAIIEIKNSDVLVSVAPLY